MQSFFISLSCLAELLLSFSFKLFGGADIAAALVIKNRPVSNIEKEKYSLFIASIYS